MTQAIAAQVLVDSDAFIGRFFPDDSHHQRCLALFTKFEQAQTALVTTNFVINEVATVLSHKQDFQLARAFLEVIEESGLPIIHIDTALQKQALQLFKAHARRGMSVTDCANVAVMQQFNISHICSFDRAYRKVFEVSMTQ